MEQGAEEFLRGMGEKMEGYFPGLAKLVDKLNTEQLGRGVVITDYKSNPLATPRDELIGYILPLANNQREHIIIFKSGDVVLTCPAKWYPGLSTSQEQYDDTYIRNMSPSPLPLQLRTTSNPNIEYVMNNSVTWRSDLGAEIKMRNSDPEQVGAVMNKVDEALVLAKETKVARDQARVDSARQLISKLEEFLNPKRPNPPEEPFPPAWPPTPPGNSDSG